MEVFSAGRAVILGGDFNMRLRRSHDADNLNFLTTETGVGDACIALGVVDEEAIDKFFFRSNATVTLTPTYCQFESGLFVTPDGEPLSDHEPLAVGFTWSGTPVTGIECL
jgi:myo-inositol-hexaphosphate 3-phosphohydrolase